MITPITRAKTNVRLTANGADRGRAVIPVRARRNRANSGTRIAGPVRDVLKGRAARMIDDPIADGRIGTASSVRHAKRRRPCQRLRCDSSRMREHWRA
jgi:hypothetical protein